ncbi:MAG: M28 family peptidase [Bacteroidota bacterium]
MRILFSLICAFFFSNVAAQNSLDVDFQKLQADVVYLASDYLEGRETGKKGAIAAANYIAARFGELGLSPKGAETSFFQTFDFTYAPNQNATSAREAKTGRNVIAYLDNQAPTTVIIGAHFDHLGRGAHGSRFSDGSVIYNGADDNASGVAGLLYLAKQLKASPSKKHNYLFIAFSAKEMGLTGSKYFVNNPTIEMSKVSYMLNLDMVGRLRAEKGLTINGAGTSPAWKKSFQHIQTGNLKITTEDSGVGDFDHAPFYQADLPVLHFFTGNHIDYHKPGDDSEKINYEGIRTIAHWMQELIEKMPLTGKLPFTKTEDASEKKAANYRVTLGVMPDYGFQNGGMRIEAVLDGRPAQKGGLEDGDVIVKMDDLDVKNIYDYMDGLSTFKRGQTVKVKVKRGNQEIEKEVTL